MKINRRLILIAIVLLLSGCFEFGEKGAPPKELYWKGEAPSSIFKYKAEECQNPFKEMVLLSCQQRFYAINGWDTVQLDSYEYLNKGEVLKVWGGLTPTEKEHHYTLGKWIYRWMPRTHYVFLQKEIKSFIEQIDPKGLDSKEMWTGFPYKGRSGVFSYHQDAILGVPLKGAFKCAEYSYKEFSYRMCSSETKIKPEELQGWINRMKSITVGGLLPKMGKWYKNGQNILLPVIKNDRLYFIEGFVPLHYGISWIKSSFSLED
jgi:hypothetical protein